jgi:hypothetical protein
MINIEGKCILTYISDSPIDSPIPEPFECPSIYEWIQTCLATRNTMAFMTLPELVATRSAEQIKNAFEPGHWIRLTPRTLLFTQFFDSMQPGWTAAHFVEALAAAGMDLLLLESLPEAILAPLQEALVQCQTEPPTAWSKDLLAIVGREDVNMLLTPGQRPRQSQSSLLVMRSLSPKLSMLTHSRFPLTKRALIFTQYAYLQQIQTQQGSSMVQLRWNGMQLRVPSSKMTEG